MPAPYAQPSVISTAVVASPALAAETVIATLIVPAVGDPGTSVFLQGWAAYTVGTSGTNVNFRIRRGGLTGTLIVATGGVTRAAASLQADDINGVDTPGEVASQTYSLTMQVTAGAAASTVSALIFTATPFN